MTIVDACEVCGQPKRGAAHSCTAAPVEPPAAPRRVRMSYRVYCVSCGRATDVESAVRFPARCDTCGGTMLLEPIE